jgi:hypothetical protein
MALGRDSLLIIKWLVETRMKAKPDKLEAKAIR